MQKLIRSISTFLFASATMASADKWQELFPNGAPRVAHNDQTAVWTGTEVIVWGGAIIYGSALNSGARYNRTTNMWTATSTVNAPTERYRHTAVWTGAEMIVWGGSGGGNTGGRYDPRTDTWRPTSTVGAPSGRQLHTAVWTGAEMIVWGGAGTSNLNTGGRYNPATDTWKPTNVSGAPIGRLSHSGVWTGTEMIVWAGHVLGPGGGATFTGGRFNPATDTWIATPPNPGATVGVYAWPAVWTGSDIVYANGQRYFPAENRWAAASQDGRPTGTGGATGVWTGSELIVWLGSGTGGRYRPSEDRWTVVTTAGAPAARESHLAVWTGREMILWGGYTSHMDGGNVIVEHNFTDTFSYTPASDDFRITSVMVESGNLLVSFPSGLARNHTLWQSDTMATGTWSDTGLPSMLGTGGSLTFTVPAPSAGHRFFRVQAGP